MYFVIGFVLWTIINTTPFFIDVFTTNNSTPTRVKFKSSFTLTVQSRNQQIHQQTGKQFAYSLHSYKQTGKQTYCTYRQTCRQTFRQTDKLTDRHTDRLTDSYADTQPDQQTETPKDDRSTVRQTVSTNRQTLSDVLAE